MYPDGEVVIVFLPQRTLDRVRGVAEVVVKRTERFFNQFIRSEIFLGLRVIIEDAKSCPLIAKLAVY